VRRLLTEFIGTFFLFLTIGLTVLSASPLAPLAIGVSLMVMVYMGGHVSGAHYNPAVTLGVAMRGGLDGKLIVPYMVAQLLGAIVAAWVVRILTGNTFAPMPGEGMSTLAALLVEILYTFALVLVVLNVAVSKRTQGNSYYGLAIGFTVLAGAFAGGAISGGAFNPAVGIGPTLINAMLGGGTLANIWLYIVGPFAGGALAAFVFGIQEQEG
jgi:aquaporin Z